MSQFRQVTIIGLGLIGGSLGMAFRRRGMRVTGYSRKPTTLRAAKRRGAIDVGTTNLRAAVCDADLVVLATPVDRIVPLARQAARFCRRGAILTDVGSTKSRIVRSLERSLPRHVSFVGAHPIAGSEQRGIGAAQSTLFKGATAVVTPTNRTNRQALRRVINLWRRLGCRVVTMSPKRHDQQLAALSHLPHVLSCCLVHAVNPSSSLPPTRSLLDLTRISKSDPCLWDAIFLSNRQPLLRAMSQFERQWRSLRRELAGIREPALHRHLVSAQRKRLRWSDD